jgi:predicted PhzF superfamily epimerase YddE/YHI9
VLTTQLTPSVGEGPLFHSRVLFPHMTSTEDPASGSPHSSLAMLYSGRFGGPGTKLLATQGGRRRGQIIVEWDGVSGKDGGRCKLRGPTVTGMLCCCLGVFVFSLVCSSDAQWWRGGFAYSASGCRHVPCLGRR